MIRTLALALAILMTVGCATKRKSNDLAPEPAQESPHFEAGMKALEREQYADAAEAFDRLLVDKPASELDLVTLFNSGAAYEGMGNCPVAIDRYRKVVRSSANRFKRLEARALFRLSLMYECVGQDTKTVTALLDALKRKSELPDETVVAEIPARLAAAYARLGNRDKAMEWFGKAATGLKTIVARTDNRVQKETLGRALYLMGHLNPNQRDGKGDGEGFLQSLSMQQPYLLQAAELDHPVWSKRAAEDLHVAYDNIWRFNLPEGERKREFYIRGLQVAAELRRIRLPEGTALVSSVFERVDETERRLRKELARLGETNPLTPDAERREGLKREGRAVSPTPAQPPRTKLKTQGKR